MARGRRAAIWSPEARADLIDIWEYYASIAGRSTADNIVHEIAGTLHFLEEYPLGGRARDEVRPGLRSLRTGTYIVFYRVADGAVQLVRLLDARRDLEDIFEEEG